MSIDPTTLFSQLLFPLLGSFFGAGTSVWATSRLQQRSAKASRRQAHADALLPLLRDLRRSLRDIGEDRDVAVWTELVENCYQAAEDAKYVLPQGLAHLKYSVRSAVGEAAGLVSLVDVMPRSTIEEEKLADYDGEWTAHAMEYVALAISCLQRWRDASPLQASKVALPTFDAWLSATGRYTRM